MHLQPADVGGQQASRLQRAANHALLRWAVGRRQAAAAPVLVNKCAQQYDARAAARASARVCRLGGRQVQHNARLGSHVAIS